ncbi:Oidioi.mRNA.OKI2018_I69.XSR.g15246.t1.cds [Oikopleura dioica]|uniref:Oidioi.mRNA.OKI2018_I69.XSR.g15246.t1.cds n=1 Tax=Oikopleura dioica TaxID=34765 RepID=A0ABN7SH98_OIKDI|nr:Oidioi.mRNA.OKI2018_I69.XSR.g15246.t1.cds [Oikopleura dioica]
MDSLARDEAARGTSYRSPFHHGDLVFAKMRGFPYWPARIDCVRPKDCNIREQGNIPDSIDFCWPIFFFGTHQISWIAESKLKMFEENRDTLGKNKHIKEAMKEALTNTGVKFQFGDGSGEVVPKMWTHGDKAKRWFRYQSDETSFVTEWDTHNRAKKRRLDSPETSRPSSSSGSSVEASEELESPRESPDLTEEQSGTNAEPVEVENESEDEEDVIIQRYREATHKIEDLSVGDFVGCMYESAYYGTVLSKNEEEKTVNVHFYTRSSHHKIYISKKKDTDTITEKRQGYIFCHIPAEKVQHGNTQVRKTKTMFLLDGVVHADIDLTEAKWRLFTAELREDEDDIETYTDEVDRLTDEIDTLNRSTYCERSTFNVPIGSATSPLKTVAV